MRREVAWGETFDRLQNAMDDSSGMFLVVPGLSGRANPMTVSWGQIGFVWSRPVFSAFVRRSRYTSECLQAADSFTINVPAPGQLADALKLCGTKSGRDLDKLRACSLETRASERVAAPYLNECDLHYECRIVARTELELPDVLAPDILELHYPKGDPHLIVVGEIVGAFVRDDR